MPIKNKDQDLLAEQYQKIQDSYKKINEDNTVDLTTPETKGALPQPAKKFHTTQVKVDK